MRDNNFNQLISDFDLIILYVLFSSEIETDDDYSIPGEIFSEDK
jgi:hypothetical protein